MLLPDLQLEAWNALPESERVEVAELLARVLTARRRPMELVDVRRFGPRREQPIARYRDERTGLVLALVPGGRLAPGLTEEQVEAITASGQVQREDVPRSRRRRAEVQVEPFLLSTTPMPATCGVVSARIDREGLEARRRASGSSCHVRDVDLAEALRDLGAELPDAHELEWAARGGGERIFPWGDQVTFPRGEDRPLELEVDLCPAAIDGCQHPFGLVALGGASVWCQTERGGLGAWSGAGEHWPWPDPPGHVGFGPGPPWLAAVCGWVVPAEEDSLLVHGLRPMLPVVARALRPAPAAGAGLRPVPLCLDADWLRARLAHPLPDKPRVLEYLRGVRWISGIPVINPDPLRPDRYLPSVLFRTDGVWAWTSHVEHYVEVHDLSLPAELLAHIRASDYRPPPEADLGRRTAQLVAQMHRIRHQLYARAE